MTYLLDVNVLIALIDPTHVQHVRAHEWFGDAGQRDWLSSPTTQNGVLRIVSNPRYSNSQPVSTVFESLESLLKVGNHRFIADDLTMLDRIFDRERLLTSAQITDTYLLGLASRASAQLATFDRKMATAGVMSGSAIAFFIP